MQLKCIAIDDEPLALELIEQFASKFPSLKLVHTFDDAIAGAEFLRANPVDLLFIDINMPDITGIELVRSLRVKPIIIFITAYKKFAIDGFELDAVDYLLKPVQFERFEKAVNKAIEHYRNKKPAREDAGEALFVRSEYRMIKIDLNDIEYIESVEDYIKIHLLTGKPVLSLMTMKTVLEKLPTEKFKRIHRSYIVPVAKIQSVQKKTLQLTSLKELPISHSYLQFIKNWIRR